jgi:hypothetical protein
MYQAANDLFNPKNSGKQASILVGLENLKNRYRADRDRAATERKVVEEDIEPRQKEILRRLGVDCHQKLRRLTENYEQILQRGMRVQLAIEKKAATSFRTEIDERKRVAFTQEVQRLEAEVREAKEKFAGIEEKIEERNHATRRLVARKGVTEAPLSIRKSDPKLTDLLGALEFVNEKLGQMYEDLDETEGEVADIARWRRGATKLGFN